MCNTDRWQQRPEGSTWGDFGPDDELGRLNLLTPAKVLQGLAEVKEGRTFCLSLPLDLPGGTVINPRRHPPVLRPTRRGGAPNYNYPVGRDTEGATDVVNDDVVLLYTQYSTQWDSFCHIGSHFDADGDGVAEPVFYNGFRPGADIVGPHDLADAGPGPTSTSHARRLGIEKMAETGVQGRAVMIDLEAHYGRDLRLVGWRDLKAVLEADRITVEPGDLVCLHTGFGQVVMDMGGQPDGAVLERTACSLDGRDRDLLRWISDTGLSALIADNVAVERLPAVAVEGPAAALPLHEHCLFKLGVPLGELWHLTPLARHLRAEGRSRFLLTAPPLRLPGAVGSPATPVATV